MRMITSSVRLWQAIARKGRWLAIMSSPPTRGNASKYGVLSYLYGVVLTVGPTEICFKSGVIPGQLDLRYGAGEQLRFRKHQKGQFSFIWLYSIPTFQQSQTSLDSLQKNHFRLWRRLDFLLAYWSSLVHPISLAPKIVYPMGERLTTSLVIT